MRDQRGISKEPIRRYCEFQQDWPRFIKPLPRDKYEWTAVDFLSITGVAPKLFVRIYEYQSGAHTRHRPERWPGHIAKIGHKLYANESITEHFLTRVGQAFGLRIADSQLRIVGGQVRFLSRYFLEQATQSLVHGAELFKTWLDEEFVQQVEQQKRERDIYTFQTVCDAIRYHFPNNAEEIIGDLTEMLAFDALIGHNDRHAYNWGVIVPVTSAGIPKFSPVFDTARALFWNITEYGKGSVQVRLNDPTQFEHYIQSSCPIISWDGEESINHFRLMELIYRHHPENRERIERYTNHDSLGECVKILNSEFRQLMSKDRRKLIEKCLKRRQELLSQATSL